MRIDNYQPELALSNKRSDGAGPAPVNAARLLVPRGDFLPGGTNGTVSNGPGPSSYNSSSPNYGYGYNNSVPRVPPANCSFADHALFEVSSVPDLAGKQWGAAERLYTYAYKLE